MSAMIPCSPLKHLTGKDEAHETLVSMCWMEPPTCVSRLDAFLQHWTATESQTAEPLVTIIRAILSVQKACKMNQNAALKLLKAFHTPNIALLNAFQPTVTANKIKSSDKSESIASNNHAWLTMANKSNLRKEKAQRPYWASCCSLLYFLFLSRLSK